LYYWKKGAEILSDPGYLWDHPLEHQNIRTVAQNTVVVNESDQKTQGRNGSGMFFRTSPQVKVMEATSNAYPNAPIYRRTPAIVDHGNGKNYAIDFFRVDGGEIRDYVFHLSNTAFDCSRLSLDPATSANLYDFTNIRRGSGAAIWNISWQLNANMHGKVWAVGSSGEEVFVADGWGQRDWKNSDIGTSIPYVVRWCRHKGLKTFISVIECYESGLPFVRDVRVIDDRGIIAVDTEVGTDYIVSAFGAGDEALTYRPGVSMVNGYFGVISMRGEKMDWKFEVN